MRKTLLTFLILLRGIVPARAQDEVGGKPASFQAWEALSPQGRQEVLSNLERYKAMSSEKKESIRERYARFRRLTPEQKDVILHRWNAFKALPPERQKAVKEAMEKRDAEKKQAFRRSPAKATREGERQTRERRERRERFDRMKRIERGERHGAAHRR